MIPATVQLALFCAAATSSLCAPRCSAQIINDVVPLTDANVSEIFQDEWVVLFHTPRCVDCDGILPEWTEFSQKASRKGIQVAACDMSKYPGLSGRFLVVNGPQVFYILNGAIRRLPDHIAVSQLLQYLRDHRWHSIDPVNWWLEPSRRHMAIAAGFFTLAEALRTFLTDAMNRYNLTPTWIYVFIFASSVILGVLAGVLLVIIGDFVCLLARHTFSLCGRRCNNRPADRSAAMHRRQRACSASRPEAGDTDRFCLMCSVEALDDGEVEDAVDDDEAFVACPAPPPPLTTPPRAAVDDAGTHGDRLPSAGRLFAASPALEVGIPSTCARGARLDQGDATALCGASSILEAAEVRRRLLDKEPCA